jgi:hypothetical protein
MSAASNKIAGAVHPIRNNIGTSSVATPSDSASPAKSCAVRVKTSSHFTSLHTAVQRGLRHTSASNQPKPARQQLRPTFSTMHL